MCMKRIAESGSDRIVVDGIRSMAEVETFAKSARVLLVTVHASPSRRYSLLRERGRKDDPLTYDKFLKRDEREFEVGIGKAIALADEVVSNQRSTPEFLSAQVVTLVENWVKTVGN